MFVFRIIIFDFPVVVKKAASFLNVHQYHISLSIFFSVTAKGIENSDECSLFQHYPSLKKTSSTTRHSTSSRFSSKSSF